MKTRLNLTLKDWITLGFSFVAVSISILSFYFSNLRVEDNLQARVADISLDTRPDDPQKADYMRARVVLVNSGNRPAMLLKARYFFSGSPDRNHGGFGNDCGVPETDCDVPEGALPLLIQPRDIRLLQLRIALGNAVANINHGARIENPPWNEPGKSGRFFVGLEMESLDSKGEIRGVQIDMSAAIDVHQQGYANLKQLNRGRFTSAILFKKPRMRMRITPAD
jgi:hypothetical protein